MAPLYLDARFNAKEKKAFCGELLLGKLSHAYIVEGEEGLGKTSFALFAAAAALCQHPETAPCGMCAGCKKNLADSHPDLFVIKAEKEGGIIPVGMIREIKNTVFLVPNESEKKVYIIEDAQKMNIPAQNALLKLLEEPPPSAIFFLTADMKESLLPTVISRCRVITLRPAPKHEIISWLLEKFPRKDGEEIRHAAGMAEGSPGLALSFLEKKKVYITEDALAFAKLAFEGSDFETLAFFKTKRYERFKAKLFLETAMVLFNDVFRAKHKHPRLTFLPYETAAAYAARSTETKLMKLSKEAALAYASADANANINLTLARFALRVNQIRL